MRRTDLMDTSDWAHRWMVEKLRQKSPEWKMRRIFELNDLAREIRKATEHLRPRRSP